MKKFVLMTVLVALSACSQQPEEATETAAGEAEVAAPADAADSTRVGTYDVKMADGSTGVTTINADGTYVDTDAAGKETRGSFAVKEGKDCFDPEGEEPEMCWSPTEPAADGSFTATDPEGNMVTVMPRKG